MESIDRKRLISKAVLLRTVPPLASVGPDGQIISKLSEIVRIHERLGKNDELMLAAGRAPGEGLAEIELAEARVDLERERGQQEVIVSPCAQIWLRVASRQIYEGMSEL